MAFHPGYYLRDIIEDMEITQDEFAKRLDTTPKTLSKLLSGQINLSEEIALKLSIMLWSGVDLWLNLQAKYNEKCIEIQNEKKLEKEIEFVSLIDYKYFVNLSKISYNIHIMWYFICYTTHLPSSGIHGAVKWVNKSLIMRDSH